MVSNITPIEQGTPTCPVCGNYPVREGYRVCASCVEAREYAPHYWEGDEPDKLPDASVGGEGGEA